MTKLKKVKLELIGEVKATNNIDYVDELGNPIAMGKECVYKDENGVMYLQTKGQFTSSGVDNWFVPITNYQLVEDFVYLQEHYNEKLQKTLRLKNSQIDLGERCWRVVYDDLKILDAKGLF